MDMQSLLCDMATDRLKLPRNLSLPQLQLPDLPSLPSLPNLRRIRSLKGALRLKTSRGRRHLPPPTGPYTVGCVDFMSDYNTDGLFMRIYYPTPHTDVFYRETQWPHWLPSKQYGQGYCYFRRKNIKVFGTIFNWVGGDVYVPVLWQAPLLEREEPYPVIIFTHGLGGNRTTYTTLCTDLASHGFIVAVIEHRDGSASLTYCFKSSSPSSATASSSTTASSSASSSSASSSSASSAQASPMHCSNGLLSDGEDADSGGESPTQSPSPHDLHDLFVKGLALEEQWMWYEKQQKEDDFAIRNKQVHLRVKELRRLADLLEALNEGKDTRNSLGLHFDMRQFKGMIDLSRLSVVGHSFGACTSIACMASGDKRFKCAVALDSWMLPLEDSIYDKVEGPLLLVNTETFQWEENVRPMYRLRVNWSDDTLPQRRLITIRGTCHQSQTDFQFVVPSRVGRMMELRHSLEPLVAMDLNSKATLGFLHKHLKMPGCDHHDDIIDGNSPLVLRGTNLNLNQSESLR